MASLFVFIPWISQTDHQSQSLLWHKFFFRQKIMDSKSSGHHADFILMYRSLEAFSKPQIALKEQVERSEIPLPGAQADEKAQHTQ
jgi:hypothetical protein